MSTTLTNDEKWALRYLRGALRPLLRPHQFPIYDSLWDCINDQDPRHASHYINCSRQLGKSFTETVVAVEFCTRFPQSTVLFVAPLRSQAEEILLGKTYFTIFERCPPHLKPKVDGTTILFPNGSRIRMGGTDNRRFEDLRGGAAHLLILDECAFMQHLDDGVLPALQPMLNTTRGKTIFSSTPAPSLEHPSTAIYRDHLERGHVSHFTIFDNSSLTEHDLIKAYTETGCKRLNDAWVYSTRFKREYLAEHVMEGTILIFPDWDEEFCREVAPNEYDPFHHRYVSMDPGVTDFNAGVLATYDHVNGHLSVEDEWTLNGPTLNSDILSQEINKKTARWQVKPYRYISDNNNPHLIQDLKTIYRLPFFPTSKSRLESKRAAYEEGMVTKVNTWLRQGRISIHPRCEMLLGNLRYGTWQDKGENQRQFSQSKQYGHFDHAAALVYLVRNVDVNTNPVPKTYGHTPATFSKPVVAPPNRHLSTLAQALRK